MSELLDIIVSAVDNASGVFDSITNSASNMQNDISSATGGSVSEIEGITSAATSAGQGIDQVSQSAGRINPANFDQMASGISQSESEATTLNSSLKQTISISDQIGTSFTKMSFGLQRVSSVADGFLSSLSNGKSASELIFGTTEKAEVNKVLINNMTETKAAAESLYQTVDEVTNTSLTSMQDLIPAMNAFKSATGASDQEMQNITDSMANFGAAVLAQTGSTERSEQAMMDLSKGIKGAYASLDQYGISEEALMRTNLWSGKEEDVEGYMAAITEVIGDTDELMNTSQGLDALIGKAFSRAGKSIGNEFLPFLKDIKRGFLDIDEELGGNLAAGLLVFTQGIDTLSSGALQITQLANGFRDVKAAFSGFAALFKGTEVATTALSEAEVALQLTNYGLTATEAEAAAGSLAQSGALATTTVAAEGASTSFWGMAAAELAALWPILLIVAALAILTYAIFEVGKSFGWWDDIGSMIGAITSGIMRLWNAFINHPDVQAALQVIADGFRVLGGWIMEAVKAVLEFFGVNTSGEFDVVAGIIEAIGNAWEMVREPVLAFCDILLTILQVITEVVNGNMDAETAIITIWNALVANLPIILQALFNLWVTIWNAILTAAFNLASRLVTGVVNYIRRLPSRINAYLLQVLARIIAAGTRWVTNAKNKANQLVTRVIAYFHSLPGKAYTQLYAVAGKITSAGQSWINNARTVASKVVTNVMSEINSLPGKVASEFKEIAQRVLNTAGALINAAKSVASRMVKAALAALQRNSPGIIQRSAVAEFTETIDRINQQVNPAGKAAYAFGKSLVDGFGKSALDLETGAQFDVRTGKYVISDESMKLDVNNNVKLELDLRNVPKHINTNELKEALTDRNVLKAIVSNNDFQDLDSRVKNKRYLRNKRANGG